jgi:ABC-type amino acid transport substrate-binding protein
MKTKLLIGADPFPPYQYYNNFGTLCGSDYEAVKKAGENAGFAMDFVLDEWQLIETRMKNHELDAIFQLPKTPEREKIYCFSKLLRNAATEVITANSTLTHIANYEEISTKKLSLGVMENFAYNEKVDSIDTALKTAFKTQESLLLAIRNGQVDLGVFDKGVKSFLMEKLSVTNLYALDALTFLRPLHLAFQDEEVRDAFNLYL